MHGAQVSTTNNRDLHVQILTRRFGLFLSSFCSKFGPCYVVKSADVPGRDCDGRCPGGRGELADAGQGVRDSGAVPSCSAVLDVSIVSTQLRRVGGALARGGDGRHRRDRRAEGDHPLNRFQLGFGLQSPHRDPGSERRDDDRRPQSRALFCWISDAT